MLSTLDYFVNIPLLTVRETDCPSRAVTRQPIDGVQAEAAMSTRSPRNAVPSAVSRRRARTS
jgi:hypothetical protein